jgi:hypothetical protein
MFSSKLSIISILTISVNFSMLSTFAVESQTKFDRDIPNSPKTKDIFLIARSNELDNFI